MPLARLEFFSIFSVGFWISKEFVLRYGTIGLQLRLDGYVMLKWVVQNVVVVVFLYTGEHEAALWF